MRGFDFYADKPVCPACGNGEDSGLVFPLTVIHFDPPSKVRGRGVNMLACQPTKQIFGRMATAHGPTVNCWDCRQTTAWKQAMDLIVQEV